MIGCLLHVVVVAIILLIVLIGLEKLMAAFKWDDPRILMLLRFLFGLLILLAALSCLGILDSESVFSFSHAR